MRVRIEEGASELIHHKLPEGEELAVADEKPTTGELAIIEHAEHLNGEEITALLSDDMSAATLGIPITLFHALRKGGLYVTWQQVQDLLDGQKLTPIIEPGDTPTPKDGESDPLQVGASDSAGRKPHAAKSNAPTVSKAASVSKS